jgi:hypothetical protein
VHRRAADLGGAAGAPRGLRCSLSRDHGLVLNGWATSARPVALGICPYFWPHVLGNDDARQHRCFSLEIAIEEREVEHVKVRSGAHVRSKELVITSAVHESGVREVIGLDRGRPFERERNERR